MIRIKSCLPIPGEFLKPNGDSAMVTEICRVLDVNTAANTLVIIPVQPRRSSGRVYFVGPVILDLSKAVHEIDQMILGIRMDESISRMDAISTDEDLDKDYLRGGEGISYPRKIREERYQIIKPLVEDIETRKMLYDPVIRQEKVAARASELANENCSITRTKKMISELIYQFFAGGSLKGALTPFSSTKGGRGKERSQKSKLGRQNVAAAAGDLEKAGFVMSDHDKDICGYSWRNFYIRGTTVQKALRKMWREFYSDISEDKEGKIQYELFPRENRPTRTQFLTWGKQRSPGHEGWKKQLTKFNLARLDRALFGSVTDDVVAIGQRGSVDSTSVDMHFVSVANRLDRIGAAHRILVVDSMYGYIPGFYLGLEAPSAATVQLAFLHALTDKTNWLKWLGLDEIDPADWIPIRFATALADNTDARCEGAVEALDQIGTGLKFVGVSRSDLNSPAETSHHILHRLVDHNMYGTTHGQRHERGEERSDVLARHTVVEAIRETARAIHTHNTMELDIVPTLEMRRELLDKGLKITRANLVRMKIGQGKLAMSLISNDEARIKLLPRVRGTFTKHGIKLLRHDMGEKRVFIEPVRYISKHPFILEKVLKAKVARQRVTPESFDDDFLYDPYNPTVIYYRDPINGELITLTMKTDDEDLPLECSLPDMMELTDRGASRRFDVRDSRDVSMSKMEEGQENTKREAEEQYQRDLEKAEKKPSKSAMRAGKKENREREKTNYQYGMPPQTPVGVEAEKVDDWESIYDDPKDEEGGEASMDQSNDNVFEQDNAVSDEGGQGQNAVLRDLINRRGEEGRAS